MQKLREINKVFGEKRKERRGYGFGEVVHVDRREAKKIVAAKSAYSRHLCISLSLSLSRARLRICLELAYDKGRE